MRFFGVLGRAAIACLLILALGLGFVSCKKNETPSGDGTTETVYYTVTFDVGGGDAVADQVVPKGSFLYEPTTPRREGWVFGGWVEEYMGVWSFSELTVERNMTLTATWLSADSVFSFEILGDAEAVRITGLLQTPKLLDVPSTINGMTVCEIGDEVFAELPSSKVSRILLPSSIRSVGDRAFANASGVSIEWDADAALTFVGEDAFLGCDGLASIRLDDSMTSISAGCFSGTSLRTVVLPSALASIPENAFEDCRSLASVTLFSGVSFVEDSAFFGCGALRALYFYGSAEQLDALIGDGLANRNEPLAEAAGYLYSETAPETVGDYGFWYYDENMAVRLW